MLTLATLGLKVVNVNMQGRMPAMRYVDSGNFGP